jgi:hypothetical protein
MKKVKKYWLVLLLGGLLMATLVGVAGARPNERPMAAVSRRITISPASFDPEDDHVEWNNTGGVLSSDTVDAEVTFFADVIFPTGQAVTVESVTFWAYDNNCTNNICLKLYRDDPTGGARSQMASVCSTGCAVGVRQFSDTSIVSNPAKHGQGVYLMLDIEDDGALDLYGVRIEYHHGTT